MGFDRSGQIVLKNAIQWIQERDQSKADPNHIYTRAHKKFYKLYNPAPKLKCQRKE